MGKTCRVRTLRRSLLAIALAFCFDATLAQDRPKVITLPQPSEGNVNGQQGISFWPTLVIDGEDRPVDPSGCMVYLVPPEVDKRLAHPCGQWFAPPPDRYTVWLEQGSRISVQTVVNSGGAKFFDNGAIVAMPMDDAGFAAIGPDVRVDGEKTVRLLSIEPSANGFEKRLQAAEAHSTNRLPAGNAIAGVFDDDGTALALSRPFSANDRKPTLISPRAPDSGSDLMLVLGKRLAAPRERETRDTKIRAIIGGKAQEPDVYYENNGRIVAIWYAVAAKAATLRLESTIFRLDEREVRLTPETVTTIREEMGLNTKGIMR